MVALVDLVLDNGELIRIECPEQFEDKLHDVLDNCRKRNDWWSPSMFDGCSAEYMGMGLVRVNMGKVIGEL